MKRIIQAAFAAIIVLSGCQDVQTQPDRLKVLIAEFTTTQTYSDLANMGIRIELNNSSLVEFHQIEYLSIPVSQTEFAKRAILVKRDPQLGWQHFISVGFTDLSDDLSTFEGNMVLDFYTEGVYSVHSFKDGAQTQYQVFPTAEISGRSILAGRTFDLEECNSLCHTLDCAGRKFEEKHVISQLQCAIDIVPCMVSLVIQCLDEGCSNSGVKTCDHH